MVQPLSKTIWKFLKMLRIFLLYDPSIPPLGVYSKESTSYALVKIIQKHSQQLQSSFPKTGSNSCPSIGEWIHRLWKTHTWNTARQQENVLLLQASALSSFAYFAQRGAVERVRCLFLKKVRARFSRNVRCQIKMSQLSVKWSWVANGQAQDVRVDQEWRSRAAWKTLRNLIQQLILSMDTGAADYLAGDKKNMKRVVSRTMGKGHVKQ